MLAVAARVGRRRLRVPRDRWDPRATAGTGGGGGGADLDEEGFRRLQRLSVLELPAAEQAACGETVARIAALLASIQEVDIVDR
jgi:hypothetical protein